MLSSFLDSIGINTQQMKEEAWNLGVSQVANPLEHTGLLKTYLYWLMVDYIRTELAPKD